MLIIKKSENSVFYYYLTIRDWLVRLILGLIFLSLPFFSIKNNIDFNNNRVLLIILIIFGFGGLLFLIQILQEIIKSLKPIQLLLSEKEIKTTNLQIPFSTIKDIRIENRLERYEKRSARRVSISIYQTFGLIVELNDGERLKLIDFGQNYFKDKYRLLMDINKFLGLNLDFNQYKEFLEPWYKKKSIILFIVFILFILFFMLFVMIRMQTIQTQMLNPKLPPHRF